MKETGILFSAPMVRALLAGRKTQTRRPAKLPDWWPKDAARAVFGPGPQFWPVDVRGRRIGHVGVPVKQCRYGMAGGRLWVKETAWRNGGYVATDPAPHASAGKRPAIHMARVDSRITLLVTELRLERVRSISRADAISEGFEAGVMMDGTVNGQAAKIAVMDPVYWFAMLWNTIHGSGAFAEDPWVWVVAFRRVAT